MLQSLRVSNFALIEEMEVCFGEGLNILTGETGAGKSILLGSVQTALGAKASKDLIRNGAESAYVELVFDNRGRRIKTAGTVFGGRKYYHFQKNYYGRKERVQN